MSADRDAFEAAFVDTLGAGSTAWYLKEHRVREDFYLFDNPTLTGMTNAAWWAWRAGREALAQEAQTFAATLEKPDVIH